MAVAISSIFAPIRLLPPLYLVSGVRELKLDYRLSPQYHLLDFDKITANRGLTNINITALVLKAEQLKTYDMM